MHVSFNCMLMRPCPASANITSPMLKKQDGIYSGWQHYSVIVIQCGGSRYYWGRSAHQLPIGNIALAAPGKNTERQIERRNTERVR